MGKFDLSAEKPGLTDTKDDFRELVRRVREGADESAPGLAEGIEGHQGRQWEATRGIGSGSAKRRPGRCSMNRAAADQTNIVSV
jgi:hypothetical protein